MHRFNQFVMAAVALALLAAPALAQQERGQQRQRGRGGPGGGGGMSPAMLLGQKSVQEELKLSDDQKQKVEEASKKMRESFQGLQGLQGDDRDKKTKELREEGAKMVADILKPDQTKRLKQIQLQVQGARAYADPEVVKELNITDEQKQKLKDISDAAQKDMQQARQDAGDNRQEAAAKGREIRKAADEKAVNVLTADQKAKWKDLTGEPFKGEIQFGQRGGGRGGRQPPRQ